MYNHASGRSVATEGRKGRGRANTDMLLWDKEGRSPGRKTTTVRFHNYHRFKVSFVILAPTGITTYALFSFDFRESPSPHHHLYKVGTKSSVFLCSF